MVRLLNQEDRDVVLRFLKKEKEVNLFIIGDIVNFGFDKPFLKLWGEFNQKNELIAVLLLYYNSFIFYSREEYSCDEFCKIISSHNFKTLSGEKSIVENLKSALNLKKEKTSYLCKWESTQQIDNKIIPEQVLQRVKIMDYKNIDDQKLDEIATLYTTIEEFLNPSSFEQLKQDLLNKSSRIFYIEDDDIVVSTARTAVETDDLAMVLSVCTLHEYRGKGYATACMIKLCEVMQSEVKDLCLFYDNPVAGKIYEKLGFKNIGYWVILNR